VNIWFFDVNRRVYADGLSGPIWRKHWREVEVGGETSKSWILRHAVWHGGRYVTRVPKVGYDRSVWAFTEAEIDEQEWVSDHKFKVMQRVWQTHDAAVLKQVAALIGYTGSAK
jgi:hypothetical protein